MKNFFLLSLITVILYSFAGCSSINSTTTNSSTTITTNNEVINKSEIYIVALEAILHKQNVRSDIFIDMENLEDISEEEIEINTRYFTSEYESTVIYGSFESLKEQGYITGSYL